MRSVRRLRALPLVMLLLLGACGWVWGAVTNAEIARIKSKVEAGESLNPAEIAFVAEMNAHGGSWVDLPALSRNTGSTGRDDPWGNRPPRRPLDDYAWADTTYSWVDITGQGTPLELGEDSTFGPIDLGFQVGFFDSTYSSLNVCSNGFVSFTSFAHNFANTVLPSASEPNDAVYAFWDDLSPGPASQILYWSDPANGRFIVSWNDVPHYGGTARYTFQLVVYSSGNFLLNYQFVDTTAPSNRSCTVGMENADGTQGLQICYNNHGQVPTTGTSFMIFMPNGVPRPVTNLSYSVNGFTVTLNWLDPTQDTNGNPITLDSIQIWIGQIGTGIRAGVVAPGVQTFTLNNAPPGRSVYWVRPYAHPYWGTPVRTNVIVYGPTYDENFDMADGLWVPEPAEGGWEWGAPGGGGRLPAHSEPNVWAVGLTQNYPISCCYLLDLNLDLPIVNPTASIEFWFWYNAASWYDGCNLKYSIDGGQTWVLLTPPGDYPLLQLSANNACIPNEPAWSGIANTDWQFVSIPLGNLVGQTPIFRFSFGSSPWMTSTGFFFDDMTIWGVQIPQGATVTGTVTLDGGAGVVTQVLVRANGIGNPSTHPGANGAYLLTGVQTGNRVLSGTLDGYHRDTLMVNVPPGGLTGQNMTLRRLNPPIPTGLTAEVNSATGLVTLDWDNSPDPLVDEYRVYRKLRPDANWVLVHTFFQSQGTDQLPLDGIYQYRLTAVDTNVVAPPVESDPCRYVEVLYGHLPPQMLTYSGHFDNKIHLAWLEPGAPPETEVFYDNGVNSPGVDGIGWWGSQPEFGWFGSHFQGNGLVAVTRIKIYYTSFATLGDPIEVGCFADVGTGIPTFEPLGVIDAVHEEPLDSFRIFELAEPVVFDDGSFFIATRQMTSNSICVGGDEETPFINNTFYYCYQIALGWVPFEQAPLLAIPMIRAFVIGDMGGGREVELQPSPVIPRKWSPGGSAAQCASKAARTAQVEMKALQAGDLANAKRTMTIAPLAVSRNAVDPWTMAYLAGRAVRPHLPYVLAAPRRGLRERNTLDEVIRYLVYRNNNLIDSVAGDITQYDNIGTIENTVYTYVVKARYDDQVLSPPSNSVDARCNMEPGVPTGFAAEPSGSTQMRLEWTDPMVNGDGTPCVDLAGIRVYRDGELLGNVGVGVEHYLDTPPIPNQFYTWSVAAYDEVPNIGAQASIRGAVQSPWIQVPMEWVDISGTGQATGSQGDDMFTGPFDIGFDFPFFGQTYDQVWVCTNGWLSFIMPDWANYVNVVLPDPQLPNAACYIWWDDLYVQNSTDFLYLQDADEGRFIVSWHCRRLGGSIFFDMQIILTDDGGVLFNYQSIDPQNTWCTVGVENENGTDAIHLCTDGQGDYLPQANTAIQFWGGPSGRIIGTVTAFSNNTPIPNAAVYLEGIGDTVTTATDGTYNMRLEPGTYTVCFLHPTYCDTCRASVIVEDDGETTVDMRMRSPVPVITPTSLTFTVYRYGSEQRTITIENNQGACPLRYSVTDTSAWLTESPTSGIVNPGTPVDVRVTASAATLQPGDYVSLILVAYNAPGTPTPIRVDLHVLDASDPAAALPTEFAYHNNYPNPFNSATNLRFDVPREAAVRIAVFNVMGQEVARPVDRVFPAGYHQVPFDARDLPSGMYVVKMTAGDFQALGKMLLLK